MPTLAYLKKGNFYFTVQFTTFVGAKSTHNAFVVARATQKPWKCVT